MRRKSRSFTFGPFRVRPKDEELQMALDYIRQKAHSSAETIAPQNPLEEAYQDTLWALLNTKEFLFNH